MSGIGLAYRVTDPPIVNFPPYLARKIMATPWDIAMGLLALIDYQPLPSSSRKNFPKFSSDGKLTTDEHIKFFFIAAHILGVAHEDVVVRLFLETLTKI